MNKLMENHGYLKFFTVAVFITVTLFALNFFWWPTYGGDTEWYIMAAEGRFSELIQPYSARFLHPFLVGFLSRFSPLDVYQSFLIVGVVSIFLFFVLNIVILKKAAAFSPILLAPIFLSPYFLTTIREIFEPDSFYIFLTALFFLFLFYKKEVYALLTFFLLFLTRESTLLLGLIIGTVSRFYSKKLLALTAIIVLLISFYVTGLMGSIGRPNVHNLSSSAYLVSKISYNFMTNVLGAKPWTNTYANCEPVFKFQLPKIKSFGDINEIGLCGFSILPPLQTLIVLLTVFGIAPLSLFYILFKRWRFIFKKLPFWMAVALIYGLAHYFVGVVAGTGIQRIVGYGWPAFLLIAPIFIQMFFEVNRNFIIKLSLGQLFVAWLPLVIYRLNGDTISSAIFIILIVLAVYLWTYRVLNSQKMNDVAVPSLLLD